jgi:Tol biopolymer transport system component
MSLLWALVLVILLEGPGCSVLSSPGAPAIDPDAISIQRHEIQLAIDPSSHRMRGLDRVTIQAGSRAVREFSVTLNKALVVAWVSSEGKLLPFHPRPLPPSAELDARRAHQVVVRLDRPARAGETLIVDFDYAGEINDPPKEPRHLRFVTPSETSGHIGPEGVYIGPETYWYPDVPNSLASYRVTATTPPGWEVIGQGGLVAHEARADATVTTWDASAPAEGLTLAAGKFAVVMRMSGNTEIATYFYPEDMGLADEYLAAAASYLDAYSRVLGPYPFPRFSIGENFFASGLGMPAYALLGAGSIRRHYTQPYALGHEIVHSWIGNHVFNDNGGNWAEGLTTYLANYYWHELKGDLQKAREERRMMLLSYAVYVPPDQDYPVGRFKRKSDQRDNAIGYNKAAMVFHMLRREIGDDRFFAALRTLVAEYGGRRIGWGEVEALFSRVSSRDLRPFFARWIERAGAADVKAEADPDYHVFRRIPRRDLHPMLNLFATDPRRIVVVPGAGAAAGEPYRELAERVAKQESVVLRSAGEVGAAGKDLRDASVLLLGGPHAGPAFVWAARGLPPGVELRQDGFRVGGKDYQGSGMVLLLSFRNPDDPAHVVSVFYGLSPEAVQPVARLLFFYGWNSYLVFENGAVIARGDEPPHPAEGAPAGARTERYLRNIRQLTHGRQNAEAYFSFDGRSLIFQSTRDGRGCYQQYVMGLDGSDLRMVSSGRGTTTCGYFLPGDRRVLFSSTHAKSPECPPKPSAQGRYRWSLDDYDIYTATLRGKDLVPLTATPGYDAEATIAPDGSRIVFTSVRDGDLDIYSMRLDGKDVKRLTSVAGYDGGPFFSPDSKRIVYRAHHPTDPAELARYRELLARNLVEPSKLEIFVMDADGGNQRQVTRNDAANFAPFFHPDGRRIIFSSNVHDPQRRTFHLFLVGDDGQGLEQVTAEGGFNSFPMFSPDGSKLVWVSDRRTKERGEFNIFLADWVP